MSLIFNLALAFPLVFEGPGAPVSWLEPPGRPARSSSPSIFCVYDLRSRPFASRVLINRWVCEGDASSTARFKPAMKE